MNNVALVTGGAGFIGSRLVARLSAEYENVVVYDNLHEQVHGPQPIVPKFDDNVELIIGDVCDKQKIKSLVNSTQPELIYHLAAETGTGQSMDELSRYCDVNVTGTANLLESALELSRCKIVLSSSRAVYGEGAYHTSSGAVLVPDHRDTTAMSAGNFAISEINGQAGSPAASDENTPTVPVSVYASTKLMQEYLLKNAAVRDSLDFSILRFQNVFGDGQSLRNPYTGVLSIFISQLQAGQTLNIYEDGMTVRDFVYVDDVVESLFLARGPAATGMTLNVGTGIATSMLDAAKTLLVKMNLDESRQAISGDFRAGDIRYAVADISKAKEVLGWEPKVSFEQGMDRLIEWSLAQ